ncbi:MAG: DNA-binding response regulator [Mucilaginibacter sp.]|nr:DNA-binding response regulator [Mucilaginibacter sp.]
MRKINCIIADDELLARNGIMNYASKLAQLNVVAICTDGIGVYSAIKETNPDLIFLDIQMPHLTGMELLRTLKNPPAIIITTAYSEFAVEGYELNVVDYLLKPISFERFLKAIDKYEAWINPRLTNNLQVLPQGNLSAPDPFIYVKAEKRMVKILLKNILYLEGLKDYVKINTLEQQIITYQTLTYFEEKLPDSRFSRVHRSFIVALDHISSFSGSEVRVGTVAIPIGRTYLRDVVKKLNLP